MNQEWNNEEIVEGERRLRELMAGAMVMPTVLLAHEIGLFAYLAHGPKEFGELCEHFKLEDRAAEGLLTMCSSCDLIEQNQGNYRLAPLGQMFCSPDSALNFCPYFDMLLRRKELFSYQSIKEAITSGKPSVQRAYRESSRYDIDEWAIGFTSAMHARGQAPAQVWPTRLDLSDHKIMLDLGGGSGTYSLEAVRQWPNLKSILLEREPVCRAAQPYLEASGLAHRVRTQSGSFWSPAEFPEADLHFYSEIFHNHSLAQCRELARNSHQRLTPKGRIVIHEMLLGDKKNGPLVAAAASVNMLVWSDVGKQHTQGELNSILEEVGFSRVETHLASGYFTITSAIKETAC